MWILIRKGGQFVADPIGVLGVFETEEAAKEYVATRYPYPKYGTLWLPLGENTIGLERQAGYWTAVTAVELNLPELYLIYHPENEKLSDDR